MKCWRSKCWRPSQGVTDHSTMLGWQQSCLYFTALPQVAVLWFWWFPTSHHPSTATIMDFPWGHWDFLTKSSLSDCLPCRFRLLDTAQCMIPCSRLRCFPKIGTQTVDIFKKFWQPLDSLNLNLHRHLGPWSNSICKLAAFSCSPWKPVPAYMHFLHCKLFWFKHI